MLPREKALNYGIKSLTNEELLALIIKTGYRNLDVFHLANSLLEKAGGFENLLALNYEELIEIKGIKNAKALEILAILEVARRLSDIEKVEEDEMNSPDKIIDYLRFNVGFSNQEEFLAVFLNNAGKIIKSEILFKGSKNASIVGIDEILRKAILSKASGIIVCHNHPSGNVEPSRADLQLTDNLRRACEMFNIRLLDHIIISKNSYYSFKQANRLC